MGNVIGHFELPSFRIFPHSASLSLNQWLHAVVVCALLRVLKSNSRVSDIIDWGKKNG